MSKYEDGSYGSLPGIALIAKVLAGRCQMKYTRVAVGKGYIPDEETPKTMTEPAEYVMDASIVGVTNPVAGECQVTITIDSANVETGFYCTGVLLYAEDPDEGEVPYTYLALENEPEWIRPKTSLVGKLATIDIIAAVGDVDKVTAVIDPDAAATLALVQQLIEEHNADPNAHSEAIKNTVSEELDRLSIVTEDNVEQMVSDAVQNMPAGSYYGYLDITIPASGWVEAEEPSADHNYTCDVAAEGVTADLIPSGGPKLGSCSVANKAEVASGCETLEGAVRFFSKKIPETDISAFIILLEQGKGETDYELPVATETTLGGVKIGEGLAITPDGTATVEGAPIAEGEKATVADANAVMDEVYKDGEGS